MPITVVNRHMFRPGVTTKVYIGRPTVLGNPFPLPRNATALEREECITRYSAWLDSKLADRSTDEAHMFAQLLDLARRGDLVLICWCAPLPCHGDVIKSRLEAVLAVRECAPASDDDETDDQADDDPTARDVDNLPL